MNQQPLLKVGIFSDVQAYDVREDWGMSNMVKALQILAPFKPDVFLNAGDIADLADYHGALKLYREIFREFFPGGEPQHVICAGNHDVWGTKNQTLPEMFDSFCQNIGIPHDEVCHTVVKGYDFIAITDEHCDDYTAPKLARVKELLDEATARDPQKPVFIVTHHPPANTVAGSYDRHGKKNLRELFNHYPQVVSFSGHTHYPTEDERAIWQKEFTAVTTSTLSYGCIKEGFFNTCNSILPFAREAIQALYMEVFADKIVIRRFNVADQCELKPQNVWQIALPCDPEHPQYGDDRALSRVAPEFPADAQAVLRYDYGFAYIIFDAAKHDDFVKSYLIKATVKQDDGTWKESAPVKYVADFYRMKCHRTNREFFKLPHDLLTPGKLTRLEIYPQESFGKIGEPLVLERVIPGTWSFRPFDPLSAPQE